MKIAIATIGQETEKFNSLTEKLGATRYQRCQEVNDKLNEQEKAITRCQLLNSVKNTVFEDDYDIFILCDTEISTYPQVNIILENCKKLLETDNLAAISSFGLTIHASNIIY